MSRQVYILGAGFSIPTGVPSQIGLTKELFNFKFSKKELEGEFHIAMKTLLEKLEQLKDFLQAEFGIEFDGETQDGMSFYLEDLYTPLDRAIQENSYLRTIPPEDLLKYRRALDSILAIILKRITSNPDIDFIKTEYVEKFARYIVKKSRQGAERPTEPSPVSVVTTNWDTILDKMLMKELLTVNSQKPKGKIDYICHIVNNSEYVPVEPGMLAIAKGNFTVKLLKIHGSTNWLHCPKCRRIYLDIRPEDIFDGEFNLIKCFNCKKFEEPIKNPILRTRLLMPTFLKDFNNFQTKLIWNYSAKEIREADEIIFIGYSFPMADFEFRQLLFRQVRKRAKIKVILYEEEKSGLVVTSQNYNEALLTGLSIENVAALKRYLSFFGGKIHNRIEIRFEGVKSYVDTLELVEN
ncbi:MAG: SIR2 family protein [Bacteroidia bacterium]|nr:SIR2 family protein [Bacteroidia bacterium]